MSNPVHDDELVPPAGVFLLATLNGEPVACGAVKLHRRRPRRDQTGLGGRQRPRA